MKRIKRNKKGSKDSKYKKVSLFQKPDVKFFRPCPLSGKGAPIIDYKNIKLLKKYIKLKMICTNPDLEVHRGNKKESRRGTKSLFTRWTASSAGEIHQRILDNIKREK